MHGLFLSREEVVVSEAIARDRTKVAVVLRVCHGGVVPPTGRFMHTSL